MFRAAIPMALAAMLAATAASAAPVTPKSLAGDGLSQTSVLKVQWRGKDRDHGGDYKRGHGRDDRRGGNRYRAGSRHDHAPGGWRRHGSRPTYWRDRGCIIVGPVWYCP